MVTEEPCRPGRVKFAVVGVATILLVVFGGWLLLGMSGSDEFDSERWISEVDTNGEKDFGVRAGMVNDVTSNHLSVGASRSDVTQILGAPDWTDDARGTAAYRLRFIKTLSGISRQEYLILTFKDDVLSSVQIAEK